MIVDRLHLKCHEESKWFYMNNFDYITNELLLCSRDSRRKEKNEINCEFKLLVHIWNSLLFRWTTEWHRQTSRSYSVQLCVDSLYRTFTGTRIREVEKNRPLLRTYTVITFTFLDVLWRWARNDLKYIGIIHCLDSILCFVDRWIPGTFFLYSNPFA